MFYVAVVIAVTFFHTAYSQEIVKVSFADGTEASYPQEKIKFFSVMEGMLESFGSTEILPLNTVTKPVFDCLCDLAEKFSQLREKTSTVLVSPELRAYFAEKYHAVSKMALVYAADYLGEAKNSYFNFLNMVIELCSDELTSKKVAIDNLGAYVSITLAGFLLKDLLLSLPVPNKWNPLALDIKLPNLANHFNSIQGVSMSSAVSEFGVSCFAKQTYLRDLPKHYYVDLKRKNYKEIEIKEDATGLIGHLIEHGVSSDGKYVYRLVSGTRLFWLHIYDIEQQKTITKNFDKTSNDAPLNVLYDAVRKQFIVPFRHTLTMGDKQTEFSFVFCDASDPGSTATVVKKIIAGEYGYINKAIFFKNLIYQEVFLDSMTNLSILIFDINSHEMHVGRYDENTDSWFYEKNQQKIVTEIRGKNELNIATFIPDYWNVIYGKFSNFRSIFDDETKYCDFVYFRCFAILQIQEETHFWMQQLMSERLAKALQYMQKQYSDLQLEYVNCLYDAWYLYHAELNTDLYKKLSAHDPLYKPVSQKIKELYPLRATQAMQPLPKKNIEAIKDRNTGSWLSWSSFKKAVWKALKSE